MKKWHGRIPVCVVFPNSYYMGMSNLAVHILYKTLNDMPDVVCERCFIGDDGKVLSIESGRPLSAFEIVFLTLSFELDYINVARLLIASSTPALSTERKEGAPILVAGGMCVTSNPEPLQAMIDLFLMGDVESVLSPFMDAYREARGSGREKILDKCASFAFAYDPRSLTVSYREDGPLASFTPPDFSVEVKRFRGGTLGSSAIITDGTEFSDMFLAEGTRGCPSRCPFCLLGNSYSFAHDDVTPFNPPVADIGLIGGGVSFHPRLEEIVRDLKGRGMTPHLPSLRMDEVPVAIIELIKDDVKTLTFGLEAATERLRRAIGKPFTDEDILHKMEAIFSIKSFNVKLYFMTGLPGETLADVNAVVDLAKRVRHLMMREGAKRGAVGSITIHVSPFVPKPATPFQWLPMDDTVTLKGKIARLKKAFGKVDNVFFTHESVKFSVLQGTFARGDRRVSSMILRLAAGESLTKVTRESATNPDFYVLRERQEHELFPWDFIKGEVRKETLFKRLKASLKGLG